ncbi:MAG TPA: hypothetical protein VM076_23975 [Gemmatimonadaceae bacterium]|nr:hypothetical protein [Gemmatimonadaceae bacterium]
MFDEPRTRGPDRAIAASLLAIDAKVTRLAAESPWILDDVVEAQALEHIVGRGTAGMTRAERSSLALSLATLANHLTRNSS